MYLTQGLHRSVQQNPDGIAVIGESGDVTFRQLEGRVARIGGGLRGLGVRSGDRIGMLATNCAQ
ncbi:MAG: fatty-acid--CoA ligase, partial [Rhodococcus sp. (in: high G+C Gram-positive bacteria)]